MTPPPIALFQDPGLTEPTPPTIEGDRIFGHLSTWDQSHVGMPGQHVKPPRSATGYGEFHRRPTEVLDEAGQPTSLDTGVLTFNTSHAPIAAGARQSDRHFDHSASIAAKVRAGEDQHGIWFSGQIAPDLDEASRWRITACALSGEWRPDDRRPPKYRTAELRHALFVPMEGFPIRRAQAMAMAASAALEDDEPLALVAAGALIPASIDPDRLVITLVASTTSPQEEDAMSETTTTPAETETTETPAASATTPVEPEAPAIATDQVVTASGEMPPGLVASVDAEAGTALVQFEVPVDQLADAGQQGRSLLASGQRDRLRDREVAGLRDQLGTALEQIGTLTASIEQDRQDRAAERQADALFDAIPAAGSGN